MKKVSWKEMEESLQENTLAEKFFLYPDGSKTKIGGRTSWADICRHHEQGGEFCEEDDGEDKDSMLCEMNTISQVDVVNVLRALEFGYNGYSIQGDRLEGAYQFASELTGISLDRLSMEVLNV